MRGETVKSGDVWVGARDVLRIWMGTKMFQGGNRVRFFWVLRV